MQARKRRPQSSTPGIRHAPQAAPQRARDSRFLRDFTRVPVSAPGDRDEREADRISGPWSQALPPLEAFPGVRIHTGARAAASARVLGAAAYTIGRDIVFDAGRFAPQHPAGRRLLAHELAHAMQPGLRIRRSPPEENMSDGGVHGELAMLLDDITHLTAYTAELRKKLDGNPDDGAVAQELNDHRKLLLERLEARVALLRPTIAELSAAGMVSNSEADSIAGRSLTRYEAELQQHELQLGRLRRWRMRNRLEEIDAELATLPTASNPDEPQADLAAARHEELLAEKKSLAKKLTSTAHEYEQFDKRWGKKKYGKAAGCSSMKEGGCGPGTLAIVINQLYAEDPETLLPGPIEYVTPEDTRAYAETNGRVCGHGTAGDTMITSVHTQWPGCRGRKIGFAQAADELRSGRLVLFLCHDCAGTTSRDKAAKPYGGHFMVLNGVDDAGETFDVLDPGRGETSDIAKMSRKQLEKTGVGFWIVERK